MVLSGNAPDSSSLDEAASPRAGGAVWVGFPFCVALTSPQFGSGILELPAGVTGILWLHTRKGITMTELRKRMIRDLQLAGLVRSTQREYLRAVRQLTASYMVAPDQLTEREVEDFLFYVRDELCVARGTFATIWAVKLRPNRFRGEVDLFLEARLGLQALASW